MLLQFQIISLVVVIFFIAPAITQKLFDTYQSVNPFLENGELLSKNVKLDLRHQLPNYSNVSWAKQHFQDRTNLKAVYHDFIVWRRAEFESDTINIGVDGLRKTYMPDPLAGTPDVWMFGGSTMWGAGVDDMNTIPSHLARKTGRTVKNFGEDGYIVRQELNALNKAYAELSIQSSDHGRTVIFYDGVNDGAGHCFSDNVQIATDRQNQIRDALNLYVSTPDALTFRYLIQPAVELLKKIEIKIFKQDSIPNEKLWSCDTNPLQADSIARSIVSDWISAKAIANSRGDRFIAILQPVSFLSKTKLAHLDDIDKGIASREAQGRQYKTIYPLIRKFARQADIEFYDFTDAFDLDEYIYIDFCHVSHNGNEIIANKIEKLLK